ncbi:MAG: flagellar biosynthesis anti-sigma factor FlgM [Armatimonadota bacterium]|nr:MAG: flagellar biosynthesis anti-sigma factor FlgM [Armatimonadota bacterium]
MRISNRQIEKLLEAQLEGTHRPDTAKDPSQAARHDSLGLSRRAADIARAQELAAGAPGIREDKVARIREQIERGEYQVCPGELADRILTEARLGRVLRKL